jgi:hypothetical protein
VDEAKSAALFLDAEPSGAVRRVGMLVYSRGGFVFENLDNVVEDAGGYGQVLVCPGDMFNNGDLDRGEILIAEPPFLLFRPSQTHLIRLEHVEEQLLLFGLEETVGVETECVEAFLREAFTRREVGRMGWKRCKRKEGVDGDATNVAEIFWECGGDGANLVGHLFVRKCEGGGIGRRERKPRSRRRRGVARVLDGVDWQARCIEGGKAVDGAVDVGQGRDDREHLDAGNAALAWARGDMDPATGVSGVSNGYLNVSIRQVFYCA